MANPLHSKQLLLKLLGTPEISWDGVPLSIPRRQARALLYRLAVEEEPLSRETLLLLFWPDAADATARRNLTRLLSTLRTVLPHPDLLLANRSGVMLNLEIVRSDTAAFMRFSAEDDEQALEDAVDLVRGSFLDGFMLPNSSEFDRWLLMMQQKFERRYLEVLSKLVSAKTAVADYATAIHYGRLYLEKDDLEEEMHRRLIELYAANGQRSAALQQFESCMVVLERELGVEPLPQTRAVYERVLGVKNRQKLPEIPLPVWNTLPSIDLPLTGREEVLQKINQAYDRYRSGGVILISGSAGVGKSRLMQEFATKKEGIVLSGRAFADGQTLPYQPLTQMLRQALSFNEQWRQIGSIWLAEISRLLPELPDYFTNLAQLVDVEAQQAQARLFEALTRLFRGFAADRPLLLCFDDIHWADESTLGWLQYAGDQLEGTGICIMATYRSREEDTLRSWKRAAARNGQFYEVQLKGLAKRDIAALLQQSSLQISDPQEPAARIFTATGGNTFFVLETIRELLEAGYLAEETPNLPLPPTVRDAVLRRAGRLSPLAKQILEVSAVLLPTLNVGVVSATAGRDEMDTAVCLEELVTHQFLSANDQLQFQHGLARDAIYQALSAWRRQLLHRRAAQALTKFSQEDNHALALIAVHYETAGDYAQAIEYYRRAAEAAQTVYAHEESLNYLNKAVELSSAAALETAVLAQLYEALADNLVVLGQFPAAEEKYRIALTMIPHPELLRMAVLESKIAATMPPQQREDDAEPLFRRALARLEEAPPRISYHQWQSTRLNIILGLMDALYFQLRPHLMNDLNEQAKAIVDEIGTLEQKAMFYTRLNQQTYLKKRYHLDVENVNSSRKTLAIAHESNSIRLVVRQQFHLGFVLLWYGDLDEAEVMLKKAINAAEEMGDSWLQNQALVYLIVTYRIQKAISRIEEYLPQLFAVVRKTRNSMYGGVAQANNSWVNYHNGDLQTAENQAKKALAIWGTTSYPFQWLGNWVVLAVALRKNQSAEAILAARAILDPKQQRMPEKVENVLETAVSLWDAGDVDGAGSMLKTAVKCAEHFGYL